MRPDQVLAILTEHDLDWKSVLVTRDDDGQPTGYTLGCRCGWRFEPTAEEDRLAGHRAEVIARATGWTDGASE